MPDYHIFILIISLFVAILSLVLVCLLVFACRRIRRETTRLLLERVREYDHIKQELNVVNIEKQFLERVLGERLNPEPDRSDNLNSNII